MSSHVVTSKTKEIEDKLRAEFLPEHPRAKISVYRYNSWSIRIRIIDSHFEGKTIAERERDVLPIIRDMSDYAQDRITMLLLITPEESNRSLLSLEFDDPKPSSIL